MTEIPTRYNPQEVEEKWYKFWQENNIFHAEVDSAKKPFCIVIPPPNVTGILHMGHALNNTIQDILIRYHRMLGEESLWMPGTDHAGIATQNVVEKDIAKQGLKRQDLGREKFLERVWQWREQYGSTIINQLKKLGASCDWPRTRFTMDEDYSKAVKEVFVQLWNDKLIYQGDYIINWCPRCQTALADEEAPHHDVQGKLYYIRYPLKEKIRNPKSEIRNKLQTTNYELPDYIVVATTRPETMLGDTAVAVNPKDKRFKKLIGETVILPLVERPIKIIADQFVDPKFGTGLVKVTPSHDPNDYQMGLRHKLEFVNILHPNGILNENAGEYAGLDRFEAREAILEDLRERKLLEKIDEHSHAVGHCYRCHTVIEPYLSKQWFVKMKPLAEKALEVVKKGKIKFYPQRWTKVYLNWMENIKDWCISRQIWWGHRIPVYYCKKCQETGILKPEIRNPKSETNYKLQTTNYKQIGIIVSKERPDKCPVCGSQDIYQDEDVLDTWFSSWLWPFATFYWPSEAQNIERKAQSEKELDYFYPTNTLVTAQEIIFFWVARMIMAGLYFRKDIPFRDVYIHGTVRDIEGKKMSKSLGNVIDPLDIIKEYGCDALRFSLVSLTSTGQDVFLSKEKFEKGRNFANKIWNASRFILLNLKPENTSQDLCVVLEKEKLNLSQRWILSNFYQMLTDLDKALKQYRFNEAVNLIYDFFWSKFCDWYLEIAKLNINDKNTQIILFKILEKSLRILHPFMPFITEEIWQKLPGADKASISKSSWPHIQKQIIDKKVNPAPHSKVKKQGFMRGGVNHEMQMLMDIVVCARNIRSTVKISLNDSIKLQIQTTNKAKIALINENQEIIKLLAQAKEISFIKDKKEKSKGVSAVIAKDISINVPLEGLVDVDKEKQRLESQIKELETLLKDKQMRLKNKAFLEKAPEEVVEAEKERVAEMKERITKLKEIIRAFN
jgi:valyl-tRNA synthetase